MLFAMRMHVGLLAIGLLASAGPGVRAQTADPAPDAPPRLVNGTILEGAVQQAVPEGLTVRGPKGVMTVPWKYLSPGTRYRYERPMLAAEAARKEAEAAKREAAAKAEAAKKAAEAKAAAAKAAAATNAPATNKAPAAATNVPAAK